MRKKEQNSWYKKKNEKLRRGDKENEWEKGYKKMRLDKERDGGKNEVNYMLKDNEEVRDENDDMEKDV